MDRPDGFAADLPYVRQAPGSSCCTDAFYLHSKAVYCRNLLDISPAPCYVMAYVSFGSYH
jgi:hypothetical protein